MIKIDLVTGFLGSGKTTFIKKYAGYLMQKGCHIGILENDFGAVNVDMMLLQDMMGENCELEMISGGCDADCHRRRFKTKLIAMGMCGYDRVIVEPSGIYEPDEFFDVLCEEPLERWYEIGNIITIVDSKLEETMSKEAEYLLASQCACAGKVVLSRSETAKPEDGIRTIRHLNRVLKENGCRRVFAEPTEETPAEIMIKDWNQWEERDFEEVLSCGYVPENSCRKMDFMEDKTFETLYFMEISMTEEALRDTVAHIMADADCGFVFRIKGFVKTDGMHWLELNATRGETRITPIAEGQEVLIVIGERLNESRIKSYLEKSKR